MAPFIFLAAQTRASMYRVSLRTTLSPKEPTMSLCASPALPADQCILSIRERVRRLAKAANSNGSAYFLH